MGVYVKDNAGNIKKLAGYITQKQNARWFLCTRSLEDGIEYYDVPQSAEEYYKTIDAYTIYSFGFAETNTTNYPKLRYGTTILDIKDVTNTRNRIEIGQLNGVYSMYTQDLVADPKMYFVGTSHPDTIDDAMSDTSINPVENKVIKQYVDTQVSSKEKQIIGSQELTLTVEGWNNNVQIVPVTLNIQERNEIDVAAESIVEWANCMIRATAETENNITFVCDILPTNPLKFRVVSTEVDYDN